MNRQNINRMKGNFLQRRYAARLGRRYVLAAASVVLFGVLGYSQMNGNNDTPADSGITQSELPVKNNSIAKC